MFLHALLILTSAFRLGAALNYNKSLNSQVRSAYHGSTGITISWNTYNQLSNPTVHYGLSPDQLSQVAVGNVSVTYNTSLTYNNHVSISGLLPNMQYYYLPDHLLPDAVAEPFTFKTSRPLGDSSPLHVAVVIDMGAMGDEGLTTYAGKGVPSQEILLPGEQNTIQSLTSQMSTYDFVAHPGDLAYADTWLKETQGGFINANASYSQAYKAYESILDDFFDQLTPITTRVPYMVSPGNHEANCLNKASDLCMPGQENFTGYINHWRMPGDVLTQAPDNVGVGNMWYSYDHGMVHFVSIDTETDIENAPDADYPAGPFAPSGQQLAWLRADLAAVNRSVTPWVVVFGHRPYYSSGSICEPCQAAFEDIFLTYSVDLIMNGHFHVFERNAPIGKSGIVDPNGLNNPSAPWYLINGLGGHYAGLDSFDTIQPYQEFGIDVSNGTYGWSRLSFHNCSHLTHELVNSSSNAVIDTATLYKARTCPSAIINNYNIPGFEAPVKLPAAIQAPYGYMGYRGLQEFNPSECAITCNDKQNCNFFTVYVERVDGVVEGVYCAFYTQAWDASFATNYGQYRRGKRVAITDAYSYTRSM